MKVNILKLWHMLGTHGRHHDRLWPMIKTLVPLSGWAVSTFQRWCTHNAHNAHMYTYILKLFFEFFMSCMYCNCCMFNDTNEHPRAPGYVYTVEANGARKKWCVEEATRGYAKSVSLLQCTSCKSIASFAETWLLVYTCICTRSKGDTGDFMTWTADSSYVADTQHGYYI